MAIYHYRCTTCGAEDTVTAKMSDPAPDRLVSCECDDPKPERIPARSGFTLRGNGWYKDGYR